MYKITSAIIITALVVLAGIEASSNKKLAKQIASINSKQSETEQLLAQKEKSSTELQDKMAQLVQVLNGSTAKLAAEKKIESDYKQRLDAAEMSQSQKQDRQNLAAQEPVLRQNGTVIFPKLLASNGNVLLLNAEFRKSFGRKLVFKSGLDISSFDVEGVHPGVLIQLGIDRAAAIQNQTDMDKQKQLLASIQAQSAQAVLDQNEAIIAKQNKQNAIQAEIDEKNRQQRFKESLLQQSADADTMRAKAARKEADAAMAGALAGQ